MAAEAILKRMIMTTDQKIDLMEYVLDRLKGKLDSEQMAFIGESPYIERIDQLNRSFLRDYQALLRALKSTEILEVHAVEHPELKDLQRLVNYVMTLEEQFDKILKKLAG